MYTETNKAIVRRLWDEVWNQTNLAVADEIFDQPYAEHEKAFVPIMRAAFPDSQHTIDDMIAEGDKVVTRFTVRGTHRGTFMSIPPTGKSITITGIWIHRLVDGRIVEGREWGEGDWLGLLQQLGATVVPRHMNQRTRTHNQQRFFDLHSPPYSVQSALMAPMRRTCTCSPTSFGARS